MNDTAASGLSLARCPHCQKAYSVHVEHAGRRVACKACHQEFNITLSSEPLAAHRQTKAAAHAPPAPPPPPGVGAPAATLTCPICQSPLGAQGAGNVLMACDTCHTVHHAECWEYNKGCGLYGCAKAPETEKLQETEIPASYWGQTQKACPRCAQVIQAAAVRCRHCGATFESAQPQEAAEFAANLQQKRTMEKHRKIGIAVLVAAALPCTAPFAAVIGVIWYLAARRTIAAMPPLHATICRLGVGIAVVMTVLILIIGAAYKAFS